MKRAVLFANGEITDYQDCKSLFRDGDYFVAVDGGGRHCAELGITPHLMVGDFDTLSKELKTRFSPVEKIIYPCDKDFIDLDLAINEALNRGFDDIIILGAIGGKRLDMELANLLLLANHHGNITIINEHSEIFIVKSGGIAKFTGKIGKKVSLIPLSPILKTGKSRGLLYELENLEFSLGESRSLSNVITNENIEITSLEGIFLIVKER